MYGAYVWVDGQAKRTYVDDEEDEEGPGTPLLELEVVGDAGAERRQLRHGPCYQVEGGEGGRRLIR
jgi:hypothetical protein